VLKPQLLVVVSFIISRNSFVRFDKQVSGQARLDQPVTVAIRRNTICQITGAYRYEENAPNNDLFSMVVVIESGWPRAWSWLR